MAIDAAQSRLGPNVVPVVVDYVEERAEDNEGKQQYVITTPNAAFTGVVQNRMFRNGRSVTFDVQRARMFVQDYGYRCEPTLPYEPPAKPKRRRVGSFAPEP